MNGRADKRRALKTTNQQTLQYPQRHFLSLGLQEEGWEMVLWQVAAGKGKALA
jgi:hypothetical protein